MDRIGWLRSEGLSDDEKRHALAHRLGVPFVQLDREDISLEALVLIPEPIAREHSILAYGLPDLATSHETNNAVEVALLDLADLEHVEFLRSRYRLLPRLTTRDSLTRGLIRYQRHLRDTYGRELERADSPNLLDTLLRHALHSRATDLHLQSDAEGLLVRYRIHGALKNAMTLPPAAGERVISKLRTLANLPQGTLPREGRLRVDLGHGEDIAVRVSTVPLVAGEKLVLHIAREKARRGFTLESLGFHGEALEAVHQALLRRRGLIAVEGAARGGPSSGLRTGATTLLYTLLDLLNAPEVSIATVEQRVEYRLPRVAQTEVSSAGLSTAAALRAALKADSDIVMISAIADRETAELAAAAAARGTLILAGLTDPDLLKPDLTIKTALLRKLGGKQFPERHKLSRAQGDAFEGAANFGTVLAALKEEGKADKDAAWKDLQFYKAVGSSEHPEGYDGFVGVQEVAAAGQPAGLNLAEDALFKAAQGLTDIEEVKKLLG